MKTNKIYEIYKILLNKYGTQGWWPFINYEDSNMSKSANRVGYHRDDYSFPRNIDEVFEVCLGSILTQNTTFVSVTKALHNLNDINALNYQAVKELPIETLKEAIKPAGYYNQKSRYILEFIRFFETLDGETPSREELLNVLGIGEETADSILLYAYNEAQFKVDAYTKRVFLELGLIDEKAKYKEVKSMIEDALRDVTADKKELRIIYQEYHALIVEHSKRFYSKKPYGVGCFLKDEKLIKLK